MNADTTNLQELAVSELADDRNMTDGEVLQ